MTDPTQTPPEWPGSRLPLSWPDPIPPEPSPPLGPPPAGPPPAPYSPPAPAAAAPRPSRWRRWGVPVVAGFLGAALAIGAARLAGLFEAPEVSSTTVIERVVTEIAEPRTVEVPSVAAAVARRVKPSIVTVLVGGSNPGTGSGVVYDAAAGYILTNQHVVESEPQVQVVLYDGRTYTADVVGSDEFTDLAVVEVEAVGLTAVEVGSSLALEVGATTVAIGNPLGLEGEPTVTVGILSAFDRFVNASAGGSTLFGMLQTDAPFTRGSSGGALLDEQGRLIGITTAVGVSDLGAEGLGFATPIEVVQRVADEIIADGSARHAFLGIEGETAFEASADGGEAPTGVLVASILSDSAAGAAGVQEGDVITTFDGMAIRSMSQLISQLRRYPVGRQVTLTVMRNGGPMEVSFALGERPPDAGG